MSKIRVGVLRGGPSSEYEVSLNTGHNVLRSLPEQYEPHDIFIDRGGVWHHGGVPRSPHDALRHVDVVFNALHGEYGEDGKVQKLLEMFGIPYTGSSSFPSAVAMNKAMTKESLLNGSVKMAPHVVLDRDDSDRDALILRTFRSFPQPSVVKPVALGSSVGVSIAKSFEAFRQAVQRAFEVSDTVLVEEYIPGREATCGVIDEFRGERVYALLPIEIVVPKEKDFFDYAAKYTGISQEICPGNFSPEEKAEIQRLAALVHRNLSLRHYSRSDFIVNPRRGIYFLEVNTLPGLTSESLVPKALQAIGCPVPQFLDHVITLALANR